MTRSLLILLIIIASAPCFATAKYKEDPVLEEIKRAIRPVELTNSEDVSIIYEVPKKDLNIRLSDINDEKQALSKPEEKQEVNVDETIHKAYYAAQSGSTETAIFLYKKALNSDPGNVNAMFSIGSLYQKLGMYSDAKTMYKKVLQADPKHGKTVSNYILLLTDEDPHKALSILKSLERVNPSYPPVLSQLAIVNANLGNYDEAQRYFISAARNEFQNPSHTINLGTLFEKKGEATSALNVYQTLLQEQGEYLSKQQRVYVIERINFLESINARKN